MQIITSVLPLAPGTSTTFATLPRYLGICFLLASGFVSSLFFLPSCPCHCILFPQGCNDCEGLLPHGLTKLTGPRSRRQDQIFLLPLTCSTITSSWYLLCLLCSHRTERGSSLASVDVYTVGSMPSTQQCLAQSKLCSTCVFFSSFFIRDLDCGLLVRPVPLVLPMV